MKRKVIALTGGIGSGKSSVAKIVAGKGFCVLDCDKIAREVGRDAALQGQIVELLGDESVCEGQLNRKFIRERVFADGELHAAYSRLFWDRIAAALTEKVREACGTVFVEIAVLDAFEFLWDEVWVVRCDSSEREARVALRDGTDVGDVRNIIGRQKEYAGTRIIDNNGSFEQLKLEVESALAQL